MASTPPTNLEDTQDPPDDKPPTQSLGPSLDSLTPEQLTQDCQDTLGDILQEVVVCSEAGVHGPNYLRPHVSPRPVHWGVSVPLRTSC